MRVNTSNVQDWRSTGRKRGRKILYESRREFKCAGVPELGIECGKTTEYPPPDAPSWFEDIWPDDLQVLTQLQVDHISKDYTNNNEDNLQWVCPSCHRISDNQTPPGVTKVADGWDASGYF